MCVSVICLFCCFFFNDTATTEIYTLSLHDALPIFEQVLLGPFDHFDGVTEHLFTDRKSTRLNSSHLVISYAVFCLKKKKKVSNGEDDGSDECEDGGCARGGEWQ